MKIKIDYIDNTQKIKIEKLDDGSFLNVGGRSLPF